MRALRWVPLTFLAGLHGFALFAAYAAVVMGVYLVARSLRRVRVVAHPVPVGWGSRRELIPTV